MQYCSQHGSASLNLELRNYVETQDSRDYNVLELRRLMVAPSSISCSSRRTQNGGATLRYHCEVC